MIWHTSMKMYVHTNQPNVCHAIVVLQLYLYLWDLRPHSADFSAQV